MAHRQRPPRGFIRAAELVMVRPTAHTPGRRGLVPFDMPGLWERVKAGTFPEPLWGDWGAAWHVDVIRQWRALHVPKEKARKLRAL